MKPWKYIVAVWLTLVIAAGFLIPIPEIDILEQSARNLFLHVPMWFTMMIAFAVAFWYSVRYLNDENPLWDRKAETATTIGLIFMWSANRIVMGTFYLAGGHLQNQE